MFFCPVFQTQGRNEIFKIIGFIYLINILNKGFRRKNLINIWLIEPSEMNIGLELEVEKKRDMNNLL